jgi:hypothetical protein
MSNPCVAEFETFRDLEEYLEKIVSIDPTLLNFIDQEWDSDKADEIVYFDASSCSLRKDKGSITVPATLAIHESIAKRVRMAELKLSVDQHRFDGLGSDGLPAKVYSSDNG